MKNLMIMSVLLIFIIGCTENQKAKRFGGKAQIQVPCGMKVNNITWKDDNLWYSYERMPKGYVPVNHTFKEVSSFSVMQGEYLIIESKCK